MNFFIGIVPPPLLSQAIADIQRKYGDNRTEPHITLRPPVALLDEAGWMAAARTIVHSKPPFEIVLTGTGRFGKRVLFIEAVSEQLHQLEKLLRVALRPFEQPSPKKENQAFHAHLTLGRLNVGFSTRALDEMQKQAEDMLIHPIPFRAEFARVYYKPVVNERYKVYEDVRMKEQYRL